MMFILRSVVVFLLFSIITSCSSSKGIEDKNVINYKYNGRYKRSITKKDGQLSSLKYENLKLNLEKELDTIIPAGKSIIINYEQLAPNCFKYGGGLAYVQNALDYFVPKATKFANENNSVIFFVYSKESVYAPIYNTRKDSHILDNGFFYSQIFKLHDNCSAQYVIRPDGKFLKIYGEDHFDDVEEFLLD